MLSACPGGDSGSETDISDTSAASALLGVGIAPNDPILAIDETVPFEARAFYEDTSVEVVTDVVQWVSTDTRIATVDANGVATAIAPGVTEIIATHPDGPSAKVNLTVTGPEAELTAVTLSPDPVSVPSGQTVQMTANASFSDGTSGNIAASCNWTSDATGVATVDAAGLLTGVSVGSTNVTATCGAMSDSAPVQVTNGTVGSADLHVSYANIVAIDNYLDYSLIIENDGTSPTPSVIVRAFKNLASAPTSTSTADATYQLAPLAAGASVPLHLTVNNISAGTYNTWVLVDATNVSNESNESNNVHGPVSVTLSAGEPDLVVESFTALSDGDTTLYEVEIANNGDNDAGSFYIDIFADQLSDPDIGDYGDTYEEVSYLQAGDSAVFLLEMWGGPGIDGYWDSIVFVDSADEVVESNEDNNLDYTTVYLD